MEKKPLTESEKITMKCVWDLGNGARLAHILSVANSRYHRKWKAQTASTFLGKLVSKGYLEQYREGRYYCYRILVDKEEYRCKELAESVRFWEDDDMCAFASVLLDERTFSLEQREVLKKVIK